MYFQPKLQTKKTPVYKNYRARFYYIFHRNFYIESIFSQEEDEKDGFQQTDIGGGEEEDIESEEDAMMTPESYKQKGSSRRGAVSAEVVKDEDVANYVKKVRI